VLAAINADRLPIVSDKRANVTPQLHSAKVYAKATQLTDTKTSNSTAIVRKAVETTKASIMEIKRPRYTLEVLSFHDQETGVGEVP
jgi:ribosome-binding factor A